MLKASEKTLTNEHSINGLKGKVAPGGFGIKGGRR